MNAVRAVIRQFERHSAGVPPEVFGFVPARLGPVRRAARLLTALGVMWLYLWMALDRRGLLWFDCGAPGAMVSLLVLPARPVNLGPFQVLRVPRWAAARRRLSVAWWFGVSAGPAPGQSPWRATSVALAGLLTWAGLHLRLEALADWIRSLEEPPGILVIDGGSLFLHWIRLASGLAMLMAMINAVPAFAPGDPWTDAGLAVEAWVRWFNARRSAGRRGAEVAPP